VTAPQQMAFGDAARTVPCIRCGAPCALAPPETDREGVVILRGLSRPGVPGVCTACNATAFLQDPDMPSSFILGEMTPEKRAMALRLPHLQAQFCAVVRAQHAGVGLNPETIDWERVIQNWDLQHPKPAKRRRAP
jgi:hypothetical protein